MSLPSDLHLANLRIHTLGLTFKNLVKNISWYYDLNSRIVKSSVTRTFNIYSTFCQEQKQLFMLLEKYFPVAVANQEAKISCIFKLLENFSTSSHVGKFITELLSLTKKFLICSKNV